jgi:Zn-dependent protease
MEPKMLALGMLWYIVFLFSTTCHEAAHAWMAMKGGDRTALMAGQMTLNPIPHMRREVFGTIVVPILSFLLSGYMIGWASAPFDPRWQDRYPKRAALMALAGPIANFLLVIASGLFLYVGLRNGLFIPTGDAFGLAAAAHDTGLGGIAQVLSIVFVLNLILGVFNLFPFPPLDGSTAIGLFLSDSLNRRLQGFIRSPTVMFIGILLAWNLFGPIFTPILKMATMILYP